jgi:3',5'-cyclic AMP phosphodiesterase CpdA
VTKADLITIAHLSDVHLPLTVPFGVRHWNAKRILGWLNWHRKRKAIHSRAVLDSLVADLQAQCPDHIAVSGDLINIGLPAEYEGALSWLACVGPPANVSLIPGNHDFYVGLKADVGVARWADYMGGMPLVFPFVRKLGGVALIGLNSSLPTPVGFASGWVGPEQLERLTVILDQLRSDGLVRIVMIHHPPLVGLAPRRRALRDADALEAVLARHGADLVLHGHNHQLMRNALGNVMVEGIGSASAARDYHDEPAATYNLIRVRGASVGQHSDLAHIQIETRGLSVKTGIFGPIER